MKSTMTFKEVISIILAGFIVIGCASNRNAAPNFEKYAFNGVAIDENLFCDQTEITNLHWLEYMYWNIKIFGENSEEHKASIPDTNVWNSVSCEVSIENRLYNNSAYRDYPVIGISQQQANDYSTWRSDRVFEVYLIETGRIESNPNQNAANYFSIARYFQGSYFDSQSEDGTITGTAIQPDLNLYYPAYRLPDKADRVMVLDYVDSTDFRFHQRRSNEYDKWRQTFLPFRLAKSICPKTIGSVRFPYRSTRTGLDAKNRFKLIHDSRGNVAEWGAEENMTYGGGWPHNVEYVLENDSIKSEGSNAWTGFRNVWEWKKWDVEDVTPK